ncbi:MAG: hypothetical protein AB7G17_08210 [Phycisphaerales bacterium]
MHAQLTGASLEELQERIKARYRKDLEALARVSDLLKSRDQEASNESQISMILGVMGIEADRYWTVAELSRTTGLSEPSVRAVLHAHRDRFEKDDTSPRRVKWRVAQKELVVT